MKRFSGKQVVLGCFLGFVGAGCEAEEFESEQAEVVVQADPGDEAYALSEPIPGCYKDEECLAGEYCKYKEALYGGICFPKEASEDLSEGSDPPKDGDERPVAPPAPLPLGE